MKLDRVLLYTDGAARGNPGPSASGFMVCNTDGTDIAHEERYNGVATNNQAEYRAVIMALEWCMSNLEAPHDTDIELRSDSEVVVKQVNGLYKVKTPSLRPANARVKAVAREFRSVAFMNVPREEGHIVLVDAALNRLLDRISEGVGGKE